MIATSQNIKNNSVYLFIFSKLYILVLDFIKYSPLTFLFGYLMLILAVLFMGTSYETGFVKLVAFTLNKRGPDFTMDINDVIKLFFIWWFVVGTFLQILSKIAHFKIRNLYWFIIISAILIPLSFVTALKINSFTLPLFLYITSIAGLSIYFILSKWVDIIKLCVSKRKFSIVDAG